MIPVIDSGVAMMFTGNPSLKGSGSDMTPLVGEGSVRASAGEGIVCALRDAVSPERERQTIIAGKR